MRSTECETCGGDGELIGDAPDARGERTDDVQPCPDCSSDDAETVCTFDYDDVFDEVVL